MLGLSKNSLQNKIPVKTDTSALKNSEEAIALRKELDKIELLSEKAMEIIDKVFHMLNDSNIIPQFINVLKKKTTEKAVKIKFL